MVREEFQNTAVGQVGMLCCQSQAGECITKERKDFRDLP